MCPVSCHSIGRCNSTQSNWMFVCTLIAHNTYATNCREQYCTSLPNLVVERNLYLTILHVGRNASSKNQTSLFARELNLIVAQSADIDIVSILKNANLIRSDIAKNTNCKTWTRERMTSDEMLRHTQRATYATNLILEQPFQWLTKLKVHLLRKTTHIMMALDNFSCDIQALDTVRIDSALCKPLSTFNLLSLSIEDLYEVATDNLTLLLRICNASKVSKKLLACIYTNNIQAQALIVVHNITELVLAQHAMVNKDTGKVLANCTMKQYCCY